MEKREKRDRGAGESKRESGLPGGGAGRKDEVGGSGVYPMSGPHPSGDAPLIPEHAWGQGRLGAAGYEESGGSALAVSYVRPERCRELMTKDPVCCSAEDPVEDAAERMKRFDVGIVPVVDEERSKTLIGVLTDRDLALRVLAGGLDPRSTTVEQVMTRSPAACGPDESCEEALKAMTARQLRRVAVVDRANRIVGIIALADIALRLRQPERLAEIVRAVSRSRAMTGGG